MIPQHDKKHFLLLTFAAILAIILLATPDTIVKSQRAAYTEPSPFKLGPLRAPQKDIPQKLTAPTTAGDLDPTFGMGEK